MTRFQWLRRQVSPRRRPIQTTSRQRLSVQNLELRCVPATFTVPTVLDTGAIGDTVTLTGELRWAISEANNEASFPGPDIINVTGVGTMTLGFGQMSITTPMTINGPGANLFTIDAVKASRIFDINDLVNGTAMPVTLTKMTLANGSVTGTGGAINVRDEDLTLSECTVRDNASTANGGGVYFFEDGKLTVRGCTISGNSAGGDGGGLYSAYDAQWLIENSTISGNTAAARGGGLCINFWNSATTGTFTMRFSTVTNNKASSTTSTGGGGAMRFTPGGPALNIESSIIAANTNPGGSAPDIRSSTVNLANSAITSTLGFTPVFTGNKLVATDVKLGPLANNGGPTFTHLPMGGSPVRNSGGAAGLLTLDQRGQPRPQDGATDMGSVESSDPSPQAKLVAVPPISTPGATPNTVTVTYQDFQSNINLSTIGTSDITITAPDGMTKLAVTGVTTDVMVNSPTINATYTFTVPSGAWSKANVGTYTVAVVAGTVSDTDTPTPNSTLGGTVGTFSNLIPQVLVVDITTDENDGNVGPGDLSLREALAIANLNPGSPDTINFDATVFATQKTILLTLGQLPVNDAVTINGPAAKVVIDANKASRAMKIEAPGIGSVISISNFIVQNGQLTGTSNAIPDNRGGGIFINDEDVTLRNCEIRNNTAFATGGGVYMESNGTIATPGKLTMLDCLVQNNTSTGSGGFRLGSGAGVSIDNVGSLTIQRTTVTGNKSTTQGGGVYFVVSGSMDMTGCLISGNTADGGAGGGGFYFYGTVTSGLKITNTTITGNKATIGPGGGIALNTFNGTSQLQLRNSTVAFNEASFGGGISRVDGDSTIPLNISSSIVAKNITTAPGGIDIGLVVVTDIPGNNNLIGVTTDGNFVMTGSNNIQGDPFTPVDPMLGPLANNGGPTLTHALLAGSKAIDAGIANGLTTDQRGGAAVRIFNDPGVPNGPGSDGSDMGAFELQPLVAPTVTKVEFNGGAIQRSMVTSATVTFSEAVSFPNGILAAFQLNRYANGTPTGLVNLGAVQSGNVVTLTFVGGGAVGIDLGGSLQDGTYELTVISSNVQGGLGALASSTSSKTHRLFGDADGNGSVTATDFAAFRLDYGTTGNSIFDYDGSGGVTAADFNQFRLRYGLANYQP